MIIHFVIIIVSYLALIRLRFVELGFRQIKRKYMQYNTIQLFQTGADRRNGILMSLLLLVAETITEV